MILVVLRKDMDGHYLQSRSAQIVLTHVQLIADIIGSFGLKTTNSRWEFYSQIIKQSKLIDSERIFRE